MGLFDSIKCKYPLPRPDDCAELSELDFNSLVYQTKDLYNGMDSYEIRENGTIWKEVRKYEPLPPDPNAKTWLDKLPKSKLISTDYEQILATTTINFYDYLDNDDNNNDYWIEYSAEFVKGILNSIKLVKFEITDNSDRKRWTQEFWDKHKKQNDLLKKTYMKYTYVPYSKFVRFIFRKLKKLVDKISSNLWKLERFIIPL